MTRISSLFAASALAVLPISAFAQTAATPVAPNAVKDTAPTSVTNTAPIAPAPVTGKTAAATTATVIQPAKPDVTAMAPAVKTEIHSLNTVNPHQVKTPAAAKTAEPAKS